MVKIMGTDLFAPISMMIQKIKNKDELHLAMVTAMKIASDNPEEGTEGFNDMVYLMHLVEEYLNEIGENSMLIPMEVFKLVFGFTEDVYDFDDEELPSLEQKVLSVELTM